jgi:uncharacterized protein (DUF2062 family)
MVYMETKKLAGILAGLILGIIFLVIVLCMIQRSKNRRNAAGLSRIV